MAKKKTGRTGPIRVGGGGVEWRPVEFPADKAAIELAIAEEFVGCWKIMGESEPSLRPFMDLKQNGEQDLDFAVSTSLGPCLLELAEFAPLSDLGITFEQAPRELPPGEKADLALGLIRKKSAHQGGNDRLLLLYNTEHAFWLDPKSAELVRRALSRNPPSFERVYFLSPHGLKQGSIADELFPGEPHYFCGDWPDEALRRPALFAGHPLDFTVGWHAEWTMFVRFYGPCRVKLSVSMPMELAHA